MTAQWYMAGAMESGSITRLLHDLREGAPGGEDRLFDRVYDELREIAARRLAAWATA